MQALARAIVFRRVIAEQAEVNEIGRVRPRLERREIALVQRADIGPDPADAMFFEQADELRAMPARVAEFEREPKIARQLFEKTAQDGAALLRA